jgi:hypothetical protein
MLTSKLSEQKIVAVLREAIELAGIAGGRKVSNRAIVERVYDSEPRLMAEYQRQWSIDRMLWMIARERRERYAGAGAEAPEIVAMQINLPGFEDLPQTIFLRNGRRQRLDYANVTQITEHIAMLKARAERSPKIVQFEAVVKVMRKYSDKQPDIRWLDVKRAELKLS